MPQPDIREYAVSATSTRTFGRVMASSRGQHLVVDGPLQNGCPGEAITPSELFLAAVASCGVELVQVIARQREVPLAGVDVSIQGTFDREHPPRPDFAVFNQVRVHFEFAGVGDADAAALVEAFKGR